MEKRGVESSIQNKMEYSVLLKNEAECNQWPIAKIVATNKDDPGDV